MSIFTDKNNLILRLTFSTSENVLLCADRQQKKKFTLFRATNRIIEMTKSCNIVFKINI